MKNSARNNRNILFFFYIWLACSHSAIASFLLEYLSLRISPTSSMASIAWRGNQPWDVERTSYYYVTTSDSFQMNDKRNYAIAIAMLGDCQLCNHREANAKSIAPRSAIFPAELSKLQVTDRNSAWFIALFTPVEIDLSNYFAIGFSTVIWKHLYCYCY